MNEPRDWQRTKKENGQLDGNLQFFCLQWNRTPREVSPAKKEKREKQMKSPTRCFFFLFSFFWSISRQILEETDVARYLERRSCRCVPRGLPRWVFSVSSTAFFFFFLFSKIDFQSRKIEPYNLMTILRWEKEIYLKKLKRNWWKFSIYFGIAQQS